MGEAMQGGFWQGSMYGLVVIAGFIILGAAIAYAMIRNRRTPREEQRTEEATRRLYEEQGGNDRTPR